MTRTWRFILRGLALLLYLGCGLCVAAFPLGAVLLAVSPFLFLCGVPAWFDVPGQVTGFWTGAGIASCVTGLAFLALVLWKRRGFCRFVCPMGTLQDGAGELRSCLRARSSTAARSGSRTGSVTEGKLTVPPISEVKAKGLAEEPRLRADERSTETTVLKEVEEMPTGTEPLGGDPVEAVPVVAKAEKPSVEAPSERPESPSRRAQGYHRFHFVAGILAFYTLAAVWFGATAFVFLDPLVIFTAAVHGAGWALGLAGLVLLLSLFFPKFWCMAICPCGSVQEFLWRIPRLVMPSKQAARIAGSAEVPSNPPTSAQGEVPTDVASTSSSRVDSSVSLEVPTTNRVSASPSQKPSVFASVKVPSDVVPTSSEMTGSPVPLGGSTIDRVSVPSSQEPSISDCVEVPANVVSTSSGVTGTPVPLGDSTTDRIPVPVSKAPTQERRGFLHVLASLVILAPCAYLLRGVHALTSRIRPPGVREEGRFLARCTRCGNCVAACPTRLLRPVPLSESIEAAGTPEAVFEPIPEVGSKAEQGDSREVVSEQAATPSQPPVSVASDSEGEGTSHALPLLETLPFCESSCTLCAQVCPTHAIPILAPAERQRFRMARVEFNLTHCRIYEQHECRICERECPQHAISFVWSDDAYANVPCIDETLCTGCGRCRAFCPGVEGKRAFSMAPLEE